MCARNFLHKSQTGLFIHGSAMNIVCIAWASLLWKPHPLELASGWHPDGPRLPRECVRDSDDSPDG